MAGLLEPVGSCWNLPCAGELYPRQTSQDPVLPAQCYLDTAHAQQLQPKIPQPQVTAVQGTPHWHARPQQDHLCPGMQALQALL